MRILNLQDSQWTQRFHGLPFTSSKSGKDKFHAILVLYGLRVLILSAISLAWVTFTLLTSNLHVFPVILAGLAVGCSHWLLPYHYNRAHFPSAIYITLFGCLIANVFAGLAEFSAILGVDYFQVVGSRRIPEDLPMLGNAFLEAFRIQDLFFYFLAISASSLCLLKKDNQIKQHQPLGA